MLKFNKVVFRLLNAAATSAKNKNGFAMPMVLGTGLIITVVAASVILQASNSQQTQIASTQKSKATESAETGVTRTVNSIQNGKKLDIEACAAVDKTKTSVPVLTSEIGNVVSPTAEYAYQLTDANLDLNSNLLTIEVLGEHKQAKTKLEVGMALTKKLPSSIPALWIKETSATTTLRNVYSNVAGPCDISGTYDLPIGNKVIAVTAQMPNPPLPSKEAVRLNTNGRGKPTTFNLGEGEYIISEITKQMSFSFKDGAKTTLFVEGNIDFGNMSLEGNKGLTTIIGLSQSPTAEVTMAGNPEIKNIHLWAPTYSVSIKGGGGPKYANNIGLFWVKDFKSNAAANANQIVFAAEDKILEEWPIVNALQEETGMFGNDYQVVSVMSYREVQAAD